MKVTLGKQLVLKRIVGSATVRWERVTALRDGGFRHNGLTYLPGLRLREAAMRRGGGPLALAGDPARLLALGRVSQGFAFEAGREW